MEEGARLKEEREEAEELGELDELETRKNGLMEVFDEVMKDH